jgi:hypothetical protein
VHIGFYDRGVDAKSTPVRDAGTLGHLHDLPVQLLNDCGAEYAGDLQNRFRVRDFSRIDPGEGAIPKIGSHLRLEIIIAPIEEMLEDQHSQHHIRRCPSRSAPSTLRPPCLERLRDSLNHGLVLEQRVALAQPVGPQLVPVRQEDLEQTALALATLNHARSFAKTIMRRQCSTTNRSRQTPNGAFGHRRMRAANTIQRLTGHFFTGK